jgi:hypothetical protein
MSYTFKKPANWSTLPLYSKLIYYKTIVGEDYAPYVDKLEAKRIVKEICDDDIKVAKVKRILSGPDDFTQNDIDPNFMIKAAHGSGWNISMTAETKVEDVKVRLKEWNRTYIGSGENQYKYIKPQFFIEEKMDDAILGRTDSAVTYMFRCIYGVPVTIGVRSRMAQNSYDMNWNLLELRTKKSSDFFEKPAQLDEMIRLAKKLSKEFEFVRIDFYLGKDGIYFSEFTFTPNGGYRLYSHKMEQELGGLWI